MSLKDLNNHFSFGENWKEYSSKIDESRICSAEESLIKYFPHEQIKGKKIIDIGCGSGLFSLAALRLGCKDILSVDIDPICVSETKNNLSKYWGNDNWKCMINSIFELDKSNIGEFDIVYSWGVLHHTGSMHEAIECASKLMNHNGKMLLGLYQKTMLCPLWVIEKKLYSKSSMRTQKIIQLLFAKIFNISSIIKWQSPKENIINHKQIRGMDYYNDLHDWLGGYPYESISPKLFNKFISKIGLIIEKQSICSGGLGITGAGVNEYLLRRKGEKIE